MYIALQDKLGAVTDLCRRHHVARLWLFGSAVSEDYDPHRSDLDFLVQYGPGYRQDPWEHYWGLKEGLERIFGRPVDLVDVAAQSNPYFIRAYEATREVVYAA